MLCYNKINLNYHNYIPIVYSSIFKYFVILSEITVTPRKTAYLLLIGAGCLFASSFTKMMELLFFS